jgi:AbrB family looped-hinge helix DNA binding protein
MELLYGISCFGFEKWHKPKYHPIMTTRLTIDGAGRVVLPKPLRKALLLGPGDVLELVSTEDKITLRPVRNTNPLAKEKGVWVFRTGQPMPLSMIDEVTSSIRTERDRTNTGIEE